jgi:hypothetical protein
VTMLEKVARAMAERTNGGDFANGRWYTEERRRLWRERARAAVEAMRPSTNSMDVAGSLYLRDHHDASGCFEAMSDAILNEET